LPADTTAALVRAESKGEITEPFFKNAAIDLLRTLGIEHEQRYLREPANGVGNCSDRRRNPLSAVALRQLPRCQNAQRSSENRWRARSVRGLCCIATEVFFANDADGGAFVLLSRFVSPLPIPLCIPPESGERERKSVWRFG
jgi:hypothetical protein